MSRAIKWVVVVGVMVVAVMITTPRLWVKNKKAHFVQNGRVRNDMKLYFGWGDRILLVPDRSDVVYVSGPVEPGSAVFACDKRDFRYFKVVAVGPGLECGDAGIQDVERSESSWRFTTGTGGQYEVTWETDYRR